MSRRSILGKKFSHIPRGTNFVPFNEKVYKIDNEKKEISILPKEMDYESKNPYKRGRSRSRKSRNTSSKKSYSRSRTRSRKSFGRKQSIKRSRTLSRGKRASSQYKSPFDKNVRRVVAKELAADNSYRIGWTDWVESVSTTAGGAIQNVFCTNQVSQAAYAGISGALGANTYLYGLLDDPIILKAIAGNIKAGQTTKFCRKSCDINLRLVNGSASSATVYHYRVCARYDQSSTLDPATHAVTLLTPALLEADNIQGGFKNADAGLGNQAPMQYSAVGATMYMNPLFTSQFVIKKVSKWEMKPAAVRRLKFSYKKPRWFQEQRYSGRVLLKGQCFSVFIICGTFACLPGAIAGLKFGISDAHIGIECKINYHYTYQQDVNIATGANVAIQGFTLGSAINNPAPVVINQPMSVIDGTGATTGTRSYATTDVDAVPEYDMVIS